MENGKDITLGSQAVQSHLTILQSVIQRMASNSSSSKGWCITIVSAVLVIISDKGKPEYAWLAFIPAVLFMALDVYYLGLEKGFRNSYNEFINKMHDESVNSFDIFVIKTKGSMGKLFISSALSPSIWIFYITIMVMIYAAKVLVLSS